MAQLISTPRVTVIDSAGAPIVGAKINFYIAGTSTRKDTYSDDAHSVANANPVITDSRGEAVIYGIGTYKVVITDADDVTIYTTDEFEWFGDANGIYSFSVETLDSWLSTLGALQLGGNASIAYHKAKGSNKVLYLYQNATNDGSPNFQSDGRASYISLGSGKIELWRSTVSGSAGDAITWKLDARFDALGNVIFGASTTAIDATDGFVFLPACSGVPTGVPAADGFSKALVLDKTNNDLYFYNSGWKRIAGPNQTAHLSLQNAAFGKGATAPTQVIIGDYSGWEYDIADDTVITIELPHDIDTSQDVALHLSWYINEAYATANGEIQWQIGWSMCPHDDTEAIDAPAHSGTVASGDINIPATAKHLVHDTSLVIAAANIADEDIIGITLSRIALDGGVNPTAKPTIIAAHIEYSTL